MQTPPTAPFPAGATALPRRRADRNHERGPSRPSAASVTNGRQAAPSDQETARLGLALRGADRRLERREVVAEAAAGLRRPGLPVDGPHDEALAARRGRPAAGPEHLVLGHLPAGEPGDAELLADVRRHPGGGDLLR